MATNFSDHRMLLTIFSMSLVDPDVPFAASPAFRIPKLCQHSQLTGRWLYRRLKVSYFCAGSKLWSWVLGQWMKPEQLCVASLGILLENTTRAC